MAVACDAASRIRGSLLGMACGDAVGTTVEFSRPGSFDPVTDMTGGGPFGLAPGCWTDDTSLGLCLAESLIETGTFDMIDQLRRYSRWFADGHLSSNGRCFDIGNTTCTAINVFRSHPRNPFAGPTGENTAGNGSLMRLCAAPLAFWRQPYLAIEAAALSSMTTHGAPQAVDACKYYAGLLVGCMNGVSKETLLSDRYSPIEKYWERPVKPQERKTNIEVLEVAGGSFKRNNPPTIKGTGYVVKTLEAALWAFYHTDDFESGCLKVVNLGDDADTTAAVYGQLAGAFYGVEGIPEKWRSKCALSPLFGLMADEIASMAEHYACTVPSASPLDTVQLVGAELSGASSNTVEPFKASAGYRGKKMKGYDLLEKEIHAYLGSRSASKKEEIVKKYKMLPAEAQDDALLSSVMAMIKKK